MFHAYSDTPQTQTLSGQLLVHTLSPLLLHLLYDIHSLTYIFHYPVITDYLCYPLPYPYNTFTWRATQNTHHGDFIYQSLTAMMHESEFSEGDSMSLMLGSEMARIHAPRQVQRQPPPLRKLLRQPVLQENHQDNH
jgi:hypothetical protein